MSNDNSINDSVNGDSEKDAARSRVAWLTDLLMGEKRSTFINGYTFNQIPKTVIISSLISQVVDWESANQYNLTYQIIYPLPNMLDENQLEQLNAHKRHARILFFKVI